ncbi:MAG: response regulator, partial [Lachnospiraceae bacterium]|nr:response regulator [Lachnospiraceae bacterium]
MRIIAVDDEPYALEELVEAIKKAEPEAEVYDFMDPAEALAFAKEQSCDVAFLDVDMGYTSGIEVAKQLKLWYP